SEVRSRGGDGLHLHNTVALGVPSDREATSLRGGRAASSSRLRLHAEPQSSLAFSLWPAVRRSQTDSESQTPRLLSDITSLLCLLLSDAQISLRLILQTPPRPVTEPPPQRRASAANGPR
ncbi:cell wall protein DAN4-like, partial [Scomber scombrus]